VLVLIGLQNHCAEVTEKNTIRKIEILHKNKNNLPLAIEMQEYQEFQ
jgi:hypothetical protein